METTQLEITLIIDDGIDILDPSDEIRVSIGLESPPPRTRLSVRGLAA